MYIMFKNTCCKLTIEIDLISYWWFSCEHILVYNVANNVSIIHIISVTKYRDAQIDRVISIVQVICQYLSGIKREALQKNNGISNLILVANILYQIIHM